MEMTNNPSNTEMKLIEQPEYLKGAGDGDGGAMAKSDLLTPGRSCWLPSAMTP